MPLKFLYALITFNIAGLCFTCVDVAIWGLMPNLSRDEQDRSQLISLSRAFSNVAGMLFAPLVIPFVVFFGRGSDADGYLWLGVVVASLSIIFCWLIFFNTRELTSATNTNNIPWRKTIGYISKSKAVFCVILAMTTFGMSVGLQNATGIYYLKYYLQLPDLVPLYIFISYSCKVVGALIAPLLLRRLSNVRTAFLSYLIMGIIGVVLFFAPRGMPVIYFSLAALFSIGIGILLVTITGMMAEASDRLEQNSGQRNDGMLFSLNALSMQTGFALSAAVAGFVLQLSGYQPNQLIQPPEAMQAINAVRCLAPALFCFTILFAFRMWPGSLLRDSAKHSFPASNLKQKEIRHD